MTTSFGTKSNPPGALTPDELAEKLATNGRIYGVQTEQLGDRDLAPAIEHILRTTNTPRELLLALTLTGYFDGRNARCDKLRLLIEGLFPLLRWGKRWQYGDGEVAGPVRIAREIAEVVLDREVRCG